MKLFILVSLSGLSTCVADSALPVDVCELLRRPLQSNGTMVHARGVIDFGAGEDGLALIPESCDFQFIIKGHLFPNAVELQPPESKRLLLHRVDFKSDEAAFRVLFALRERTQGRVRIAATAVGVFETRSPLESLVREDRPFPRYGFGHMNGRPAQIILKTLRDIRTLR